MGTQNKTKATDKSFHDFIQNTDNPQRIEDSTILIQIMRDISGCNPVMWGPSIIGFDTYHYRYDSGREGDMCIIGFSPRKNELSVYFVDGLSRYTEELTQLGPHRSGKACLYIKNLGSINLEVLRSMIKKSYTYTKTQDGEMHRAL